MSFSFGQSTFGAKPTAFGSPFGATTTTTSTGFGGFGSSTFSTPVASTAPAFANNFGTPAASATPAFGTSAPSTAPAFGSTFGTPATSAPAFGSAFGTAATSAPYFGSAFGSTTTSTPSFFGTPATKPSPFDTSASTGNIFSTPATTISLFGGGTTTTSQAPSLFGTTQTPGLFGTQTSAPSLFGGGTTFGTTTTASTTGLFGSNPAPTFGGGTFGSGLFSTATTTTTPSSLFSGFSTQTQSAPTGFGGFGIGGGTTFSGLQPTSSTGLFGGFNAAAPVAKPPTTIAGTQEEKNQQVLASIYAIEIHGDERDAVLKKWNMLQACWGTGKGYFSLNQPPVEYDHTNPFYRFKAVGYNVIPTSQNTDGLVKLHFNKKETEISPIKESIINGIFGMLGNRPNLTVNIEHIKPISRDGCEVMISVTERGPSGASKKIYATDLSNFLNQPTQKQQLSSVGVYFVGAFMAPTKAQLEEYLKVPPPGIDLPMWEAAQLDNPDPSKFIPVPMFGFLDLRKRMLCQQYETSLHKAYLQKFAKDMDELRRRRALSMVKLGEAKQGLFELQHRVLRVIAKQEAARKAGIPFQGDEEVLRANLESLYTRLNVHSQFRGRLHELSGNVALMDALKAGPSNEQYRIEPAAKEDLRQFLKLEQKGITEVVKMVNKDLKDLKMMQEGLSQSISESNKSI